MDVPQVTEELIFDSIGDILIVLSDVISGGFNMRLPDDLPEDHPFFALYQRVNGVVDALLEAQQRSASYQSDLEEKLRTIDQQRVAIHELSTPVIEVWEGVLCLPVIGLMDDSRSAEMAATLLQAVADKKARCAIIDTSGLSILDTATASHFLAMARSVRLLGAECVLTGISPAIAQTLIHLDVDLAGVRTHRSLRDALALYILATRPAPKPAAAARPPAAARPAPAAKPAPAPRTSPWPTPSRALPR